SGLRRGSSTTRGAAAAVAPARRPWTVHDRAAGTRVLRWAPPAVRTNSMAAAWMAPGPERGGIDLSEKAIDSALMEERTELSRPTRACSRRATGPAPGCARRRPRWLAAEAQVVGLNRSAVGRVRTARSAPAPRPNPLPLTHLDAVRWSSSGARFCFV